VSAPSADVRTETTGTLLSEPSGNVVEIRSPLSI
jgi:hypothetical protein